MRMLFACGIVLLALAGCGDSNPAHYQATVNPMGGRDVPAGPIWNDQDAYGKCPSVCGAAGWSGAWHTTVEGAMSVCSCGGAPGGYGVSHSWTPMPPMGRPTSCSAAGNDTCSGCSVSCPAGKQATCREGEVHATEGFSPTCWTKASCECK